jgi:hypothetical protein
MGREALAPRRNIPYRSFIRLREIYDKSRLNKARARGGASA